LPHSPVIGTTYEADEGLASKCKARLLPNGYLSGQLGQVLGHCAMHELYILQQTMLLASHCWNRCKHVSQHVVDCVLVVGASSTIRDSKSTTIPRIRLVMVCLLRLIHTRTIDSLGGILSGRVQSLSRLSKCCLFSKSISFLRTNANWKGLYVYKRTDALFYRRYKSLVA